MTCMGCGKCGTPSRAPGLRLAAIRGRLIRLAGVSGEGKSRSAIATRKGKETDARPDLVKRNFKAPAPSKLWVADIERHEELLSLAVVKGHRWAPVAAGV